jgi:hypothetical protein
VHSVFDIHIGQKISREANIEPPMHIEYFLSGLEIIFLSIVSAVKALIYCSILAAKPGYMMLSPDITI